MPICEKMIVRVGIADWASVKLFVSNRIDFLENLTGTGRALVLNKKGRSGATKESEVLTGKLGATGTVRRET